MDLNIISRVDNYTYTDYTMTTIILIITSLILLIYKYTGNTNFIHLLNSLEEVKQNQKEISKEINKNTDLSLEILEVVKK